MWWILCGFRQFSGLWTSPTISAPTPRSSCESTIKALVLYIVESLGSYILNRLINVGMTSLVMMVNSFICIYSDLIKLIYLSSHILLSNKFHFPWERCCPQSLTFIKWSSQAGTCNVYTCTYDSHVQWTGERGGAESHMNLATSRCREIHVYSPLFPSEPNG